MAATPRDTGARDLVSPPALRFMHNCPACGRRVMTLDRRVVIRGVDYHEQCVVFRRAPHRLGC